MSEIITLFFAFTYLMWRAIFEGILRPIYWKIFGRKY